MAGKDPDTITSALEKTSLSGGLSAESANGKADPSVAAQDTVRKTPFSAPAESITIPAPADLTSEQSTKYTSLLETVRTWPESQQLTEQEQSWLTRECLLRYLRASSWNVSTAQKRLEATLEWRRSYGINSKLTADYVSIESETGKQWILGYDSAGRPCLYLNPSRQNTQRSDRQIEHLVFMLERSIDLTPAGQESLALLMNFAETRSGQGASIAQGRQTLFILQNHYPERLGRALLTNLPWHISGFMKLILPFVDPVTRAKIVINQPMGEYVPAEQLRISHGGSLEFEYEHDIYWPEMNKLATQRREDQFQRWVKGGKHIGELEMYLKGGVEEGIAASSAMATGDGAKREDVEKPANGAATANAATAALLAEEVERDGEVFQDAPEESGLANSNGKVEA